jgi:diguanylate cyclase (GGDEF)-like protein
MIISEANLVKDLVFNENIIKKYIKKSTPKSLKYLKKVTKTQFEVLKKYSIKHVEIATPQGYPLVKFFNSNECDDIGGEIFEIAEIIKKSKKSFHDFIVTTKGVLFVNVYPLLYDGKIIALSEIGVKYRDFLTHVFKRYFIGFVIKKSVVKNAKLNECVLNRDYYIDGNICRYFKNFNKKVDFSKKINIENGFVIFSYPVTSLNKHIGFFVKIIPLKDIEEITDLKKEFTHSFTMLIILYIVSMLFIFAVYKYFATEKIAITDNLTEILNRSGCEKYIKHLQNYALMVIDIDFFKKINDTYGHDTGDEVLKDLSEIITNTIRQNDIVCRWGGEEFVVILPNASLDDAIKVAEKIRNNIKKHMFSKDIKLTVSIGISIFEKNFSKTFKKADEKLYEAKNSGRDRVSF